VYYFFIFSHKESQHLKQEQFYLAILASWLLHLSCLLHWICQNVKKQQTKKKLKVVLKPTPVNVYKQFLPMKIIKKHKKYDPGDHFVRWEINK